jgi:6-pyruvoyltetrahydropterin/6-carboxytetrahydropterin synthase
MIQITRRETFNAAHRLFNPKWSVEKNFEVFGPCSRVHGHNWELFVTVIGEVSEDTGFVVDLKALSRTMREEVISKVDHTYLNEDVPFLTGKLPTTENFAIAVWNILQPAIKERHGVDLYKVKLTETANHFVEYYGHS